MAAKFNAHNHVSTRLISSWLHEIPSDAGAGSEATLIAPSACQQSSPRTTKDDPRRPRRSRDPSPLRSPGQAPSPVPDKIAIASPTRFPRQSVEIARPSARENAASEAALRNRIIANFRARCTSCNPANPSLLAPAKPSSPSPLPNPQPTATPGMTNNKHSSSVQPQPPLPSPFSPLSCPRCEAARSYTLRPHHSAARFLATHLLPISEVLSFDETAAYVNEAIISRLAGVLARQSPPSPSPLRPLQGVGQRDGGQRMEWEEPERTGGKDGAAAAAAAATAGGGGGGATPGKGNERYGWGDRNGAVDGGGTGGRRKEGEREWENERERQRQRDMELERQRAQARVERGIGRTYPTLDDFDKVRELARVRKAVFEGFGSPEEGWELGLDRFGMVRDRLL